MAGRSHGLSQVLLPWGSSLLLHSLVVLLLPWLGVVSIPQEAVEVEMVSLLAAGGGASPRSREGPGSSGGGAKKELRAAATRASVSGAPLPPPVVLKEESRDRELVESEVIRPQEESVAMEAAEVPSSPLVSADEGERPTDGEIGRRMSAVASPGKGGGESSGGPSRGLRAGVGARSGGPDAARMAGDRPFP